jgi:hypothetical protein
VHIALRAGLAPLALLLFACGGSDDDGGPVDAATADGGGSGGPDATTDATTRPPGTDAGPGAEAGGTGGTDAAAGDGSTGAPTSCSSVTAGPSGDFGGYRMFPASHPLNTRIDTLGVSSHSSDWIANCGASHLQADYSMPYNVAAANTPPSTLQMLGDGTVINPWPFAGSDVIEGGHAYDGGAYDGDHHCLVFSLADCKLYETYQLMWTNANDTTFNAYGADVWDTTGTPAPNGGNDTSVVDAAGLPLLATLIRYDEMVTRHSIEHALRFTCQHSSHAFIPPARAYASGHTMLDWPPMGARARLKAGFDVTGGGTNSAEVVALLTAIQQYGIILADNGSGFFVTGDTKITYPDVWTDPDNSAFNAVTTANLEFVDEDAQIQTETP